MIAFVRGHPLWTAVILVAAAVLVFVVLVSCGEGSGSTGVG